MAHHLYLLWNRTLFRQAKYQHNELRFDSKFQYQSFLTRESTRVIGELYSTSGFVTELRGFPAMAELEELFLEAGDTELALFADLERRS